MRQLLFLLVMATLLVSGCKSDDVSIPPSIVSSKPNILLIIADDVGIEATPGYSIGATKPNMPMLQKLAANGVTFDNVWAYPVCSPTRSSILTGKYGYHTGVLNAEDASTVPASEKTLQAYIDEQTNNAYSHAIIGKWHLSNKEPQRPTQMGVGYYAGLLGGGVSDYNSWSLTENGQTQNYSGYITTKITDLAIDWIDNQEKPWFCWLAYTAPHTPFHLPPTEMHSQGSLASDQASIDANPFPYFMAMTESIDYEVTRLLATLSESELENTTIIFISDNGSHPQVVQAPFQTDQAKGSLYQGGINVPMVISGKGVSRINEREGALISSTDLFSTIAELCGADVPTYEGSYSFKSLLNSTVRGAREYNYSEILNSTNANKSGYTIRNEQFKLIVFDSGQRRFYDLKADPYETSNLLSSGLSSEQQTAMTELMNKADEIRQ